MKNIIFLINIKNPNRPLRDQMYELSIQSWKRWALKNNSEVLVLDEPVVALTEMTPIIQRHYVFDILDHNNIEYDQICMVDADTIVHPNCPNFFELSEHKFCAVHNDGDYDWLCRSVENYEFEFYGSSIVSQDSIWKYFNAGFLITNKSYKWIHSKIVEFYWENKNKILSLQQKYGVGTDQPLINMMVRHLDINVKLFPYQFNMQDIARKNILDNRLLFTQIEGVYHFNAIPGGHESANIWIEKTYNKLWKN